MDLYKAQISLTLDIGSMLMCGTDLDQSTAN